MLCMNCGMVLQPGKRFCGDCGAAVAVPLPREPRAGRLRPDEAQRRQLTVMFCDVVGSTALARQLDPEDLAEALAAYQAECQDVVSGFGGYVAQFLGDGILVYFGFPVANDDDPLRAVRCGLALLDAWRRQARAHAQAGKPRLAVRIGVHTGLAVVKAMGQGPNREALALGDTPNIAARVQSNAPPDGLVVSQATWQLCKGHLVGSVRPAVAIKGLDAPMDLWDVTGTSAARDRLEGQGRLTDYVGRAAEQAELARCWDLAADRFVPALIRGEAGIGKSRLLARVRDIAAAGGARILEMRCTPFTMQSPLFPMLEMLEQAIRPTRGADAAADLERVRHHLHGLGVVEEETLRLTCRAMGIGSPADGVPEASPARIRMLTLQALVRVLFGDRPPERRLVILEDLHWADATTLDLLALALTSAGPGLLLATARPDFQPRWQHEPSATLVELERVDTDDAHRIVRAVAHGKPLPAPLARLIIERADGVPLFLEEITHAVIDGGVVTEGEAVWHPKGDLPDSLIPVSVDASLMARIDRLGEARHVLQLAAVLGREASLEVLRELAGLDDASLRTRLDRIVASGLGWIVPIDGSPCFVFKHALIRDAAYDSLSRRERESAHGLIAEALTGGRPGIADERPELLGRHLSGACRWHEAADCWEAAGRHAIARSDMVDAVPHLTRAIECLERAGQRDAQRERELALETLRAQALVTTRGWAHPSVKDSCERVQVLATSLGQPDKMFGALTFLWSHHFVRGDMDEALAAARRVHGAASGAGVPMLLAIGHGTLAFSHVARGEFDDAQAHCDAGLRCTDDATDRMVVAVLENSFMASMHNILGVILWMRGDLEASLAASTRAIDRGRSLGHKPALAFALGFATFAAIGRAYNDGELRAVQALIAELLSLSIDEGFVYWEYLARCLDTALVTLGAPDAPAVNAMNEAFDQYWTHGSGLLRRVFGVIHADTFVRIGRIDEALRVLDRVEPEGPEQNEAWWLPEIARLRGVALFRSGRMEDAVAALQTAFDQAAAQGAWMLALRAALSCHECAAFAPAQDRSLEWLATCLARGRFTGSDRLLDRARALLHAG